MIRQLITIFRHGSTNYTQGEVSIAEANDLTPAGEAEVRLHAARFAESIGDEPVFILSSPTGRTLHTAKLIVNALQVRGVPVRESDIVTERRLTEVANFTWKLFCPLILGGEVEYAGRRFAFDPKLTNPRGLTVGQYYNGDAISAISSDVRAMLPPEYVAYIDSIEKFGSVSSRLLGAIGQGLLYSIAPRPSFHLILVTHDALAGFPAAVFSEDRVTGVPQGQYISMHLDGNRMLIDAVPGVSSGRNDICLLDAFQERFLPR